MIVVDASAALSQVLASQRTDAADVFFQVPKGPLIVPSVFEWEFLNNVLCAERRGALTPADSQLAATVWLSAVRIVASHDARALFPIARAETLSLFDACYFELAVQEGAALASRDKALLEAAGRHGVAVHDLR